MDGLRHLMCGELRMENISDEHIDVLGFLVRFCCCVHLGGSSLLR